MEMRYTLERPRANQYPTEKIITELRRVANLYGNRHFSRREFDEKANECKGSVVISRFGAWQAALDAAGLNLKKIKKDRSQISNEQLFIELGRVWRLLGHRPSKDEWENSEAKFSYTTYKARFKGWVNACAAFIENASCQNEEVKSEPEIQAGGLHKPKGMSEIQVEEKRNIPMKLRYRVLTRDSYKCVLCGRSPATHVGISLHIDHINPFSQGGKTQLDNLRTLCDECNWGKGSEV